METTTRASELAERLRATTAILRLTEGVPLGLPDHIRHAAGFDVGDTIYLEVIDEGDAGRSVRLRKIDPDQAWFWTPEWQAGEREADAARAGGRSSVYHSAEEFLDALK